MKNIGRRKAVKHRKAMVKVHIISNILDATNLTGPKYNPFHMQWRCLLLSLFGLESPFDLKF
jgi:hypothetical protein